MATFTRESLCPFCEHCQIDYEVGYCWCEFEGDEELPDAYFEDEAVIKCPYFLEFGDYIF